MNEIIRNEERKDVKSEWFEGRSTFPFQHQEGHHAGFGVLKLVAQVTLKPNQKIPNHFQSNMEVLSYIISGRIIHTDSLGFITTLSEGVLQKVSTGAGVFHSEFNALEGETQILQMWISPEVMDSNPTYDEISLLDKFGCSDLVLAVSGSGRDGSMKINQDMDIYIGKAMMDGENLIHTFRYRKCWLQVIKGDVSINDERLKTGDGMGIENVDELFFKWTGGSHFIIFDLPN